MTRLPDELAIATLRIVRDLAVETGAQILALGDAARIGTAKGDGPDLVTKADAFSEAAISAALARHFPEHRIAGEEGTQLGPADSPWTWHIDPLDGTGNYSRGLPHWAISIGLAHGDEPVLGVIHSPECALTVYGAVGLGAWSGERPLPRATRAGAASGWVVATDWPWDIAERARTAALLTALAPSIRQYKTVGSAAVDFAHLALGRIDAYAISRIFPWDQAAGAAIVRSLGYELHRWSGEAWDLRHADIIACRPGMATLLAVVHRC